MAWISLGRLRTRPLGRLAAGTLLCLASSFGALAAEAQSTHLFVRDAWTGHGVPGAEASIGALDGGVVSETAELGGQLALAGSIEGLPLVVQAPGYRAMVIDSFAADRSSAVTGIWLQPDQKPRELERSWIEANKLPATSLLHGHVVDPGTGRPVVGAKVLLDGEDVRASPMSAGTSCSTRREPG